MLNFANSTPPVAPPDPVVALSLPVGVCAVPRSPLTEAQLCDWIADARIGEAIQYHEGLLLQDRSEATSPLPPKERARLHAVARRAWIACELGLVHLFSIKVDEGYYRYLALRSAQTLRPLGGVGEVAAEVTAEVARKGAEMPVQTCVH